VGGIIESGLTGSFEQMVLADEFSNLIYRLMQGFEVTEETLAVEVIKKVGPGGHFLSNPHTMKHAMKELWYPKLIDRQSLSKWKENGAKRMEQRANERAKEILRTHKPAPLEKSVQDEISEIVKETESILLEESLQ
jgi:trimethylamine--corrinoid protein Co-methyltransferase